LNENLNGTENWNELKRWIYFQLFIGDLDVNGQSLTISLFENIAITTGIK
jgi:hypothetical protein